MLFFPPLPLFLPRLPAQSDRIVSSNFFEMNILHDVSSVPMWNNKTQHYAIVILSALEVIKVRRSGGFGRRAVSRQADRGQCWAAVRSPYRWSSPPALLPERTWTTALVCKMHEDTFTFESIQRRRDYWVELRDLELPIHSLLFLRINRALTDYP